MTDKEHDTKITDLADQFGLKQKLADTLGKGWEGKRAAHDAERILAFAIDLVEASPLDEKSQAVNIAVDLLQGDVGLSDIFDKLNELI